MIYYTGDTHFGHGNIIKYCERPFETVAEMDKTIIARWNSRVKPRDTVYHVGDFAWKDPIPYLRQLNGQKHIIFGNHDQELIKRASLLLDSGMLTSVSQIKEVHDNETHIVLCHYKMHVWNRSHHGSLHFYGHSHGSLPGTSQSLDVGVDCWGFRPVTLEEIKERLSETGNNARVSHG